MKPTRNIMATVSEGNIEEVKNMLKRAPFLVHAKDSAGRTPLSVAAWCGHEAVVRVLLDFGADVNIRDRYGWTPLREAETGERNGVVRLLRRRGGII